MALDRWQQQLCDLLAAVHIKQQQYDQAVSACQVLLKPWPRKTQESESAAKKEVPDRNGNAADVQISPREEAELKVVNDLLKRAQKARVKTTSKKVQEQNEDDLQSSRSGKELWESCDSKSQTIQESSQKEGAPSFCSKPILVVKSDDDLKKNTSSTHTERPANNVAKKQQQRTQPVRERGDQSSRPLRKNHSAVPTLSKPPPTLDQKRSKSFEKVESSRAPSRPRSGRASFKPAHTTAPFKTDPNLHVPKCSAKNSIRPVKQHPASKRQNYVGDKNYMTRVLPPVGSDSDPSPSLVPSVEECNVLQENVLQDFCDTHSLQSSEEPQPGAEHQTGSSHEEKLNSKLTSVTLESDSARDVSSRSLDAGVKALPSEDSSSKSGEKEIKQFSLLSDGSKINIPPKARRAFAKNQQLRKKMSQRNTGRKSESESDDLGQKFADKLEQLFDPEEELVYRQKALECLRTHQQLLELLAQLDLEHLTETSRAEDILRAKMLAEFVLSNFSAYSEEVNMLSKVQFPDIPAVVEPPHKDAGNLYSWLPASLQGENPCSADRLVYTSKAELNQYMTMLLRLQTLQCRRQMLDILISDVLPWLYQQQQDCCQEDFGAIFSGVYALLASDGSQMPVLICDM
ncbi:uncharacterized protein LOC143293150 [Babylonia areolata]|uniref:uncharacterized protein LOC143293150 n=1 Tax=Babylonia areolata TaxID=304850 RepID=UPI003FD2AB16